MGVQDFFRISSFCYGTIEVDDIPAPLCFTVCSYAYAKET